MPEVAERAEVPPRRREAERGVEHARVVARRQRVVRAHLVEPVDGEKRRVHREVLARATPGTAGRRRLAAQLLDRGGDGIERRGVAARQVEQRPRPEIDEQDQDHRDSDRREPSPRRRARPTRRSRPQRHGHDRDPQRDRARSWISVDRDRRDGQQRQHGQTRQSATNELAPTQRACHARSEHHQRQQTSGRHQPGAGQRRQRRTQRNEAGGHHQPERGGQQERRRSTPRASGERECAARQRHQTGVARARFGPVERALEQTAVGAAEHLRAERRFKQRRITRQEPGARRPIQGLERNARVGELVETLRRG